MIQGKHTTIIKKAFLYTCLLVVFFFLAALAGIYFFQDKIIGATVQQLNRYLTTKIEVDPHIEVSLIDHFPSISVEFKNVKIFEDPKVGKGQLAGAQKLFFAFSALNLFQGKYIVDELTMQGGFIHIKIDSLGKVNYNILKTDSGGAPGQKKEVNFKLEEINLKEVSISYNNIPGGQYHEVLFNKAKAQFQLAKSIYFIKLKTDAEISTIRVGNQNYFRNKEVAADLELSFQPALGLLQISKGTNIKVESADLKLHGLVQVNEGRFVDLHVEEEQGDIQTILSLLPENLYKEFRAYQSDGNVFLKASIKGEVRNNLNPLIEVQFGFKNATFYHPELHKKINHANLTGYFTNGHGHRANTSSLRLEHISCDMDGRKLQGNFILTNFEDPRVNCSIRGILDAQFVVGFYPLLKLDHLTGLIDFNVKFNGRVNDLKNKSTMNRVNAEGEISLFNLNAKLKSTPYALSNISGDLIFNNNDLSVSELKGKAGRSDFFINGFMKNFISGMLFNNRGLYIEADLSSDYTFINELMKFNNSSIPGTVSIVARKANPQDIYHAVFKNMLIKLNCDIKNIIYDKLHAKKITGDITWLYPNLYLNNILLQGAGGSLNTSANVRLTPDAMFETRSNMNFSNINIDSLFYIFDNFDQNFITNKNIKGELSGTMNLVFSMDKKYRISSPSIIAGIDATIARGELHQFEPLQKLSKFIAEDRLAHIQFSELKNKIFIEHSIVNIPEMEIKSTVSELHISGTHSFSQNIDYRLSLPLKNLQKQKRDSDEAFGAIQEEKRGQGNVFLTIKGTTENYKIAYDKQRTQVKIKEDLKKEKAEFLEIFKKKSEVITRKETQEKEQEFFDFD